MTAAQIFEMIKAGETGYSIVKKTKCFTFYKVGATTIRVHVSESV